VPDWLQVIGRLHPVLLHLPIGLVIGVVAMELGSLMGRGRGAPDVLLRLTAVTACLTAGAGWLLHLEEGYESEAVLLHRNLGLGFAASTVLLAWIGRESAGAARARLPYRGVLAASLILVAFAAHRGGSLTHGEGFLTAPFAEPSAAPSIELEAVGPSFPTHVAPLVRAHCISCHGPAKRKARLRLDEPQGLLAGGESGPVLVAGDPASSEIVRRLRLPLADEDHMPPEGKPQPNAELIARLEAWIAAGAPLDARATGAIEPEPDPAIAEVVPPEPPEPKGPPPLAPAAHDALAALRAELVHVEALSSDSNELWIDFAGAAARTDDGLALRLLEPLVEQVAELSLARTTIGEATLALVARMPRLRRLDLRAAPVADAGLALLGGHARLETLVLVRARLSDAAVDTLLELPALRRVYLWESGIGATAIARLRDGRPELAVDAGDTGTTEVAEAEDEVRLGPAPPPGLEPTNAVCPVSGSAVDPRYAIVFGGRVIGFCCPNCPKTFWADPSAFEAALPQGE
jgi:hypothetical protein